MNKFIVWLEDHPKLNLIIWLLYALIVILPHEWVGLKINKAFKVFSRDTYNNIILCLSLVLLLVVFVFVYRKLKDHPSKKLIIGFFGLTCLLIYFVNSYLFVVNIESVHYVQYAIAAVLIFPIFNNYYLTLFWTTLMGVVDESYQYFYLAPERTDYFDINDIITNFLGVAMGLLILKSFGIVAKNSDSAKFKKFLFIPGGILVLIFTLLAASSVLSIYPSGDTFMLVRTLQIGFWTELPPNIKFHVVSPIEGLIYLPSLFLVYYFCFRTKLEEMH